MRLGAATASGDSPPELPGYEMLGSIGRGGMGEVFRARQASLGRDVAVKVLRADLHGAGWLPERFENEARTMAGLHHPNLVTVHDCARLDDGRLAIVMEEVAGGSLRGRIADGGLPLDQAIAWARDIASGLGAAHAAGVVHRDVKPENVLIDSAGRARVTDFGLAFTAAAESPRFTQTGAAVGTLGYMAPEQLRGGEVDERTDVFSLGVLLYEMLTGRLPQGTFRPARELRPEVPATLDAFIQSALRPERELRPANVAALLSALDAQPALITRRRAMAAAAVCAGAFGGWWAFRGAKDGKVTDGPGADESWQRVDWPLNPVAATISGGWRIAEGALISDENVAIVGVADSLPEVWRARVRFTRLAGMYSVGVFFRNAQGTAVATLAGRGRNVGGVQSVAGLSLDESGGFEMPLENGRGYEWIIELRSGRIRMWVDGAQKYERIIAGRPLSVPQTWAWTPTANSPALLLGSWKSPTRFESLDVRPL
jgi:Protein kinase domain